MIPALVWEQKSVADITPVLHRRNEHLNYSISEETSWREERVRWAAKLDYCRRIISTQVITGMEKVRQCEKETKKVDRQVEGQRGKGIICASCII